jgi:hypothetical protein
VKSKYALYAAFILTAVSPISSAAVLYTEEFFHSIDNNVVLSTPSIGWKGYIGVALATSDNTSGGDRMASSSVNGSGGTRGFVFAVNETTQNQKFTAMDSDFSPLTPTTISWKMASNAGTNNGADATVRVLILQGSTWYASNTTFSNSNLTSADFNNSAAASSVNKTLQFSLLGSEWREFNFNPGTDISVGQLLGDDLSSSQIDGIGFFIQSGATSTNVRIDALVIEGVPEPHSIALFSLLGSGLVLRRRRR